MQLSDFGQIAEQLLEQKGMDIRFGKDTLFSAPVALRRDHAQYDAMFLYARPPKEKDARSPRPFAWALLDAYTGKVSLLCRCDLVDFMPPGSYPADSTLPMTLPKPVTARKLIGYNEKLMEVYEEIRGFAFEEPLTRSQATAVTTYKDLFGRLTYTAHYPFYYALSPAFFHWLRMPLPQEALMEPTRLSAELNNSGSQYLVLQNLQQLVKLFQDKISEDQHKEKLFDELHYELQQYKNDFYGSLTIGLERDVIQVIDDVVKSVQRYRSLEPTAENYGKLLSLLSGVETDLEDLLYRHGVEPFADKDVDVTRQKILNAIPTEDPGKDKRIAESLARGWEKSGKIIRPQRVSVYVYNKGENETDE